MVMDYQPELLAQILVDDAESGDDVPDVVQRWASITACWCVTRAINKAVPGPRPRRQACTVKMRGERTATTLIETSDEVRRAREAAAQDRDPEPLQGG